MQTKPSQGPFLPGAGWSSHEPDWLDVPDGRLQNGPARPDGPARFWFPSAEASEACRIAVASRTFGLQLCMFITTCCSCGSAVNVVISL